MFHISRRTLLASLGATIGAALPGASARAGSRPLRIGYQRSSTLLTVLKSQGVLEKALGPNGYDVQWFLFTDVIPPMIAGATDFHADVADAVPVFTQAAGAKLTIYAREAPSPRAEAIIVPEGSSIRSVADLKGRTVGVHRGSGAHFMLAAALKRVGLSFADITPAYLAPVDAAPAFAGGSIDAWSIWDPFLAIAEYKAPVRKLCDATGLSGYARYYLVNDDYVAREPAVVRSMFDALATAGRWVKANPVAAANLLSPLWGNIPAAVVQTVDARRSYKIESVTKADLSDQQKIADTFFEAHLIPRAIDATAVKLWQPGTNE